MRMYETKEKNAQRVVKGRSVLQNIHGHMLPMICHSPHIRLCLTSDAHKEDASYSH